MRARDKAHSGKDFNSYRTLRNKVKYLIRKAKQCYFRNLVNDKTKSKDIWKGINMLTNKQKARDSGHSNNSPSSSEFSDYFISEINSIKSKIPTSTCDVTKLSEFCESKCKIRDISTIPFITIHEVYTIIVGLKNNNSSGLDGISNKMLRFAAPVICESLAYIYNLCFSKNYFPSSFKIAKVRPLLKSSSLDSSKLENYRPISLLSVLSKPFEKHIYKATLQHLTQNDLIIDSQSGFRQKHSCHSALTKIIDNWHLNINNGKMCGAVFVDFKKAFDMIDHDILILKLETMRVNKNSVQLLKSFLTDRKQMVLFNNSLSTPNVITSGVPQGSILGPLLFTIYINDLPLHIINSICDLFADDCTIHKSDNDFAKLEKSIQNDINILMEWTVKNRMQINISKTKSMLITTRQKLSLSHNTALRIVADTTPIESVHEHKTLGVIIDQHLTFNSHILKLTKQTAQKVHQLSKIKHFLDEHARVIFFKAHIQSNLDYCSTVWDMCPSYTIKRLCSLHKRALRLVSDVHTEQSEVLYERLHILPPKKRFLFNKAKFIHKILHHNAPSYLTNLFKSAGRHSKRLKNIFLPKPKIGIFMKSLSYSGVHLWNSLPFNLKTKVSPYSFNRQVFYYLLKSDYKPP
jgi:hypothetical protein